MRESAKRLTQKKIIYVKVRLHRFFMAFIVFFFAVSNAKTTKYSSETNLSTVLVRPILFEHNTRPARAFTVCQRFSSLKRFRHRWTVQWSALRLASLRQPL